MNFTDIIEQDLKNLINETKRKYPNIRDDAQNALNLLNQNRSALSERSSQSSNQQRLSELPLNEIMNSIEKIPETKQQKLIEIAMGMIQKMSNLQILSKKNQEQKLTFLFKIKQYVQTDDNFNLKLVQLVLMLVNPNFIDFKTLDHVEKIMNICMSLLVSKNILIKNSCIVGLQQLIHIAFKVFSAIVKKKRSLKYQMELQNSTQSNKQLTFYEKLQRQDSLQQNGKSNREDDEDKMNSVNNSELSESVFQQSPTQFDRIYKNAEMLLDDILNYFMTNTLPSWIPKELTNEQLNSKMYQQICQDLLLFILKEAGDSLEELPAFYHQIQTNLDAKINKNLDQLLTQEKVDFEQAVRVFRSINRLQSNLKYGFNIYNKLYSYIQTNQKFSLYTFIITETIQQFLGNQDILVFVSEQEGIVQTQTTLQQSQDENSLKQSQILNNSNIQSAFKCITFIGKMVSALNLSDLQPKKQSNIKSDLISESWTDFPKEPTVSYLQIYKSLLECCQYFQDSVMGISKFIPQLQIGQKLKRDSVTDQYELDLITQLINHFWKENLKILQYLNKFDVSESLNQNILNIIQNWISICGTLQIHKARDAFLKLLSDHSLDNPNQFTIKNNQTTKTIFNITHCLYQVLDTSSWHIIFITLQKLQGYFNKKQRNDEEVYQNIQTDSDVQILSSLLEQIFSRSPEYDDEMLVSIINALNTVTLSILEKNMIEQKQQEKQSLKDQYLLQLGNEKFALNKMLEVVSLNIDRIYLFWDLVAAHFLCIANSKHDSLRIFSIEILNNIVNNAFGQFLRLSQQQQQQQNTDNNDKEEQYPEQLLEYLEDENSKWSREQWQQTVFLPYLEIIRSQFPDTKEALLHNLLRVLQNNGHNINRSGFSIILEVLNQVAEVNYGKVITSYAFHCLEIIINQHIHVLENIKQIKMLMNLIEHFKIISQDQNITYLSVNMFWNVSDHLTKLHQNFLNTNEQEQEQEEGKEEENQKKQDIFEKEIQQFEQLWHQLFQKLTGLCVERSQMEVRNSALHTYSQIIMSNTNKLFTREFWNKIIRTSYLSLIDSVIDIIEAENQNQFQTKAKQLETPKFAVNETPKFMGGGGGGFNFQNKKPPSSLPAPPVFVDISDWQESLRQILLNLNKLVRKISKTDSQSQQQQQYIDDDIMDRILEKIIKIQKIDNFDLKFENMKFLKEMVHHTQILIHNQKLSKDIMNQLTYDVEVVPKENKNAKIMIQKVIPQIMEIFETLYQKTSPESIQSEQQIELWHTITEMFLNFYKQVLGFVKQMDLLNVLAPFKVWDESPCQLYIVNIAQKLQNFDEKIIQFFYNFITDVIQYTPVESILNDLIVRSFFKALTSLIVYNNKIQSEQRQSFLEYFFKQAETFLLYRFSPEYIELFCTIPKKLQLSPIWITVNTCFLDVCTIQIAQDMNEISFFPILESLLIRPQEQLDQIPEQHMGLTIQKLSEIEFECIEFLITQIMSEKELEEDLIDNISQVLQQYTETLQQAQKNDTSQEENHYEIQKKYLQNLFIISDKKNNSHEQFLKISKTVVPLLLFRCQEILDNYHIEEQQSENQMPLPKQRTQEVIFILSELKTLDLPNGCFQQVQKSQFSKSPQFTPQQTRDKKPSISVISLDSSAPKVSSPKFGADNSSNNDNSNINNTNDNKSQKSDENSNNTSKSQFLKPDLNSNNNKNNNSDIFLENGDLVGSQYQIKINTDNPFLKGNKAHLIYLFPTFTRMIMTRDESIRKVIQQIFFQVSCDMSLQNI